VAGRWPPDENGARDGRAQDITKFQIMEFRCRPNKVKFGKYLISHAVSNTRTKSIIMRVLPTNPTPPLRQQAAGKLAHALPTKSQKGGACDGSAREYSLHLLRTAATLA
jgi:hypothetical protein